MDEELIALCTERIHTLIRETEDTQRANVEDIKYGVQSLICILQNFEYGQVNNVLMGLSEAVDALERACVDSNYMNPTYVCVSVTGMKGRPKLQIPAEVLEFFVDSKFSLNQMSALLGVSKSTVSRRLHDLNISLLTRFSCMSNDELDEVVAKTIRDFPNIGYRSVKGHIERQGFIVQQQRIMASMRRVDLQGVLYRRLSLRPVQRRVYSVRAPLSLWHIDGYHKLISWRLVIHGGIDGYSRLPVYLKVNNNNNRATSVLHAFQEAVREYGIPECVRSDKGGENVGVAEYMLNYHGSESSCFIAGRSVHNQRTGLTALDAGSRWLIQGHFHQPSTAMYSHNLA